jgi:Legionella pneumophila major outer membrane protein precursor
MTGRTWLVASLALCAAASGAFGQPPPGPPFPPTWSRSPGPTVVVVDTLPPRGPASAGQPDGYSAFAAAVGEAPAPNGPFLQPCACELQDNNGNVLVGDPLLDPPDCPRPGWFTGLETSLIKAHIKNHLSASVPTFGLSSLVSVPQTSLDWTVSPRVEVGYRLPQGAGEVVFAYRFLFTRGSDDLNFLGVPVGQLDGRLNQNVFDFDYQTGQLGLAPPGWDVNWRLGARLAQVYFDDRSDFLLFERRVANAFLGAGPHFGMDLWRCFGGYNLMLFSRLDGSTVIGRITQSFEQQASVLGTGLVSGGAFLQRGTQTVPTLNVQAGLAWVPPLRHNAMRVSFGYEFDKWWNLGQLDGSNAELAGHGIFLRVECGF